MTMYIHIGLKCSRKPWFLFLWLKFMVDCQNGRTNYWHFKLKPFIRVNNDIFVFLFCHTVHAVHTVSTKLTCETDFLATSRTAVFPFDLWRGVLLIWLVRDSGWTPLFNWFSSWLFAVLRCSFLWSGIWYGRGIWFIYGWCTWVNN